MINVLVADDHAVVRLGLRQILTDTPDIVVGAEAGTRDEALQLAREQRFNVAIVDVNLKGASGIDLVAELRRERPELRVLVLTVYSEDQYAVRAIKAGAHGFLTKESAPERLVEAVRKIASGGRYVSAEVAERLASFVADDHAKEPHERLSNREFEIMKWLAAGKSVTQIAADLSLSVKTVSTHRTRILGKMGLGSNAELASYALKNGLLE